MSDGSRPRCLSTSASAATWSAGFSLVNCSFASTAYWSRVMKRYGTSDVGWSCRLSGTVFTTASIWATTCGSIDADANSLDAGAPDPVGSDGRTEADGALLRSVVPEPMYAIAANWGPVATFVRGSVLGVERGTRSRYHAPAATIETISSKMRNSATTLTALRAG